MNLVQEYLDGATVKELSIKYGIKPYNLTILLKSNNCKMRRRGARKGFADGRNLLGSNAKKTISLHA